MTFRNETQIDDNDRLEAFNRQIRTGALAGVIWLGTRPRTFPRGEEHPAASWIRRVNR